MVSATPKLEKGMGDLRKLLKPESLSTIGEESSDGALQAGAGFIFGNLPDDVAINLSFDLH